MIESSFFTFHPQIKPHSFKPSEDHPSEYLLLCDEEGISLGISLAEKRLIELCDGSLSLAEIVEKTMRSRLASLSSLRRLIWDLDRYGFLVESPWKNYASSQTWGYWGKTAQHSLPFVYSPILGALESKIGKFLSHPWLMGCTPVVLLFSFWWTQSLWKAVPILLINNSTALAIWVVIASILAGCLLSTWITGMTLQALHPAPIPGLLDYRFGIPLFRLDGRRLRSLPFPGALRAMLTPVLVLSWIAAVCEVLALYTQGARREWLFHTGFAFALSGFIQLLPWHMNLITRDVLLRLRTESIFKLIGGAVRKTARSLIHHTWEGVPQEKLFFGWGIWTLLATLLSFRLFTYGFRIDFPILLNHFLMEENPLLISLLLLLLAVVCAAAAAALLTFCLWLLKEAEQEIRHRFWPQKDHLLVWLGCWILLFLFSQFLWAFKLHPYTLSPWVPLLCGIILSIAGFRGWKKDQGGTDSLIHIIIIFWSFFLLGGAAALLPIGKIPVGSFFTGLGIVAGILQIFLNVYLGYLCGFRFKRIADSQQKWIERTQWILIIAAILLVFIASPSPRFPNHTVFHGWQIITAISLVILAVLIVMRGSIRNSSFFTLSLSMYIMQIGMFWNPEMKPTVIAELLIAGGTIFLLGGLCLRSSGLSKTALGIPPRREENPTGFHLRDGSLPALYRSLVTAMQELYHAEPRLPLPEEYNEDQLRIFIHEIYNLTGARALRAIIRRVMLETPWDATQRLCSLLPVAVSIPNLSDWTEEEVVQHLQKVPTFLYVGEEIHAIAARARFVLFDAGETIIHQGEQGFYILILAEGRVAVEEDRAYGHNLYAVFSTGDFVGEIGFLSGERRTASIRALQPILALAVHRQDMDESMPRTLTAIHEAVSGRSWMQTVTESDLFRDFPPTLITRIGLESQPIQLNRGQTFPLDKLWEREVVVFLSGEGALVRDGVVEPIQEGWIVGLEEQLQEIPLRGVVRADSLCRILVVERSLMMEAITELLIPQPILESAEAQER